MLLLLLLLLPLLHHIPPQNPPLRLICSLQPMVRMHTLKRLRGVCRRWQAAALRARQPSSLRCTTERSRHGAP